jgi:hypothetical protein
MGILLMAILLFHVSRQAPLVQHRVQQCQAAIAAQHEQFLKNEVSFRVAFYNVHQQSANTLLHNFCCPFTKQKSRILERTASNNSSQSNKRGYGTNANRGAAETPDSLATQLDVTGK